MDRHPLAGDDGPDSARRRWPGLLRAFRDRYVATFGGLSYDLAPDAVGVAPDLLERAPELAGKRVLVTAERPPPRPFARRPSFLVVPLTRGMRNAREVAEGGVVFSSFALDDEGAAPLLERLGVGDAVFLNAAVGLLPEVAVRRPFADDAAA